MPGAIEPLPIYLRSLRAQYLLLTDGSVICQHSDTNHWWKPTPEINGRFPDQRVF